MTQKVSELQPQWRCNKPGDHSRVNLMTFLRGPITPVCLGTWYQRNDSLSADSIWTDRATLILLWSSSLVTFSYGMRVFQHFVKMFFLKGSQETNSFDTCTFLALSKIWPARNALPLCIAVTMSSKRPFLIRPVSHRDRTVFKPVRTERENRESGPSFFVADGRGPLARTLWDWGDWTNLRSSTVEPIGWTTDFLETNISRQCDVSPHPR